MEKEIFIRIRASRYNFWANLKMSSICSHCLPCLCSIAKEMAKIKTNVVMCEIGRWCGSFCGRRTFSMLASWWPLETGQASISCTWTLMISVTQPSLSLSFSVCLLSPFTYFWVFFFFLFVQRAKIQRPKMTLNPLKGSTEITVSKCQPSQCPPSSPCAWELSHSPSLPLVFFQLRGADSPDTIIQLYCGTATVAAALCKGFPRMARGQCGLSRRGSSKEKHSY